MIDMNIIIFYDILQLHDLLTKNIVLFILTLEFPQSYL